MNAAWRLLREGTATGARNMAVDQTLLESAAAQGAATLRFYRWQPFCLSLGRLQKTLPPAVTAPHRDFDAVRRPTGGRAVWHAHEITYALAMPLSLLPDGFSSVNGAYRWLSAGFSRGLRELGLPVEMAAPGVRTDGPNCFAASASCDFLLDGKKLIGAAQCRQNDALLQHGSILLSIDRAQWQARAGGPMDAATALDQWGVPVAAGADVERIVAALCAGFAAETGAQLAQGELTAPERERVAHLERAKYASQSWTLKASFGDW